MKRSMDARRWALLGLAGLLGACGSATPAARLALEVPWSDYEVTHYDAVSESGAALGTASWTLVRDGGAGWTATFELTQHGKTEQTRVELAEDLSAVSSTHHSSGSTLETTWGPGAITIRRTARDGGVTETSLPAAENAIDNDAALTVQRALPLGPGFTAAYTDVVAKSSAAVPVAFEVIGEESVTVPAGTFACWHAQMRISVISQDVWYAKDRPRLLVKYVNPGSGTSFVLRSWQTSPGGPLSGSQEPAPVPAPRVKPPVNVPFLVLSLGVQLPLMLLLPLALGAWLSRRHGARWKLWGAGALAFVLSQVVHLPLNWAVGLLGTPRLLGLLPLPGLALAAGLSAGLCEEVARWLMMRFALKRARSYREALQFGAGHGGVEAMIIGTLAAVALVAMLALRTMEPSSVGIPEEAADQLATAVEKFWSSAWYMPVVSGLERVFAITAHVAMSVMVMRAVARRQLRWLFAAIGAHALMDAFAVWGMRNLGVMGTEVGVAVLAVGFLGVIWALRDDAPATDVRGVAPAP